MSQKRHEESLRRVDISDPSIMQIKPYNQRRCAIMATISKALSLLPNFSSFNNNIDLPHTTKALYHRPLNLELADTQITTVDLQKMMEAGMNIVRFKMPNYSKNDRIKLLGKVDKAASSCCRKYGVLNWPVATCIELKTCVIKTGILEPDVPFVTIKDKSEVILTCNIDDFNKCNERKIFLDNPALTADITVGKEVTVASDEIVLTCTETVDDKSVKCIVKKGGNLFNVCNVSIRGITHSRPVITKRDLHLIRFALEYQVDMITINYVRNVDTIMKVKEYIGKKVKRPMILSGICTEQGLNNIDGLLKESDGIILSREFLPYELEESKRFRLNNIQKWVAAKCQQAGKPLFLSGGVLQGILVSGEYNYCEVVDISNAVMDGITGFILRNCENIDMLLESIRALDEVCSEIEPFIHDHSLFWNLTEQISMPLNAAEAAVLSCAALAVQTNARVIILPTVTGRTAKALVAMRPTCLILVVCTSVRVTRMLYLFRCMVPLLYSGKPRDRWHLTVDARIDYALEFAVRRGWLQYGDVFVTLQRGSEDISYCDMVRLRTVTISQKPLVECSDDEDEKKIKRFDYNVTSSLLF